MNYTEQDNNTLSIKGQNLKKQNKMLKTTIMKMVITSFKTNQRVTQNPQLVSYGARTEAQVSKLFP